MKQTLIKRGFDGYSIKQEEDVGVIDGFPIVYEQWTDIGGMFREKISRGAITEKAISDVAFFCNHDLNTKPLARTRTGKLTLDIQESGLHMKSELNLNRSDCNDFYMATKDGDIDGMSFLARVDEDEWFDLDTDYPSRIIRKIGYIHEISGVNFPAYKGTQIEARDAICAKGDKDILKRAREKAIKKNSLDDEIEVILRKYRG